MNSPSFLARAARVLLVTGLALVALILLATYASSVTRGPHTQSWTFDSYNEGSVASSGGMVAASTAPSPMMYLADSVDRDTASVDASTTSLPPVALSDKIIKTGSIDMTATDVAKTSDAITSSIEGLGGFVQNASRSEDQNGLSSAYITARVPNAQFDTALTAIKALGAHVNNESIQGDDVTEQYTDLSARLTAARAQEAQYLVILTSAKTVGDVLAVQEHLSLVRADIESLQGQIAYLENRTSLSTISVSLSEEPNGALPSSNDKFDLGRDAALAWAFVISSGEQLLSVLVWVLIVGAPIGVVAGIVALIVRLVRHRANRPAARRR